MKESTVLSMNIREKLNLQNTIQEVDLQIQFDSNILIDLQLIISL